MVSSIRLFFYHLPAGGLSIELNMQHIDPLGIPAHLHIGSFGRYTASVQHDTSHTKKGELALH